MRGRSPIDLLLYEASRKPAIAALVDRIEEMDDLTIDTVEVPLPWFRKALKELRQKRRDDALLARTRAQIEDILVFGVVPDPMGETRRWAGGKTFLNLDRGNSIEIDDGALLWLPDAGGVWIDTAFSAVLDPRVVSCSQTVERTTKSGYMVACRERRCRLCPSDAPVIGAKPSPLGLLRVRIG